VHRVAADEDQPRPEEPAAGDDLGGHPGRVHDHLAGAQHVAEPVLADQHEQGGADPDQGVRAQPGALLPDLPLQPDDRGQQQAQAKLADLHRALGVGGRRGRELMTQQRVSYPITITASMSCDADSD